MIADVEMMLGRRLLFRWLWWITWVFIAPALLTVSHCSYLDETVVEMDLVAHLGLHSTRTSHGQPMYLISAYASWSLSYLLTYLSVQDRYRRGVLVNPRRARLLLG